jgi:hypothetical protein
MDQIWGEYGLVAETFYRISLSIREGEGMQGNRGFNPKEKGNHGVMGTRNNERERDELQHYLCKLGTYASRAWWPLRVYNVRWNWRPGIRAMGNR